MRCDETLYECSFSRCNGVREQCVRTPGEVTGVQCVRRVAAIPRARIPAYIILSFSLGSSILTMIGIVIASVRAVVARVHVRFSR